MGRTKKRYSNRHAAKRAERELQRQSEEAGLESSPTRRILRPEKARASENYIEDPRYRQLLDYLVRSVLHQFGLIDYQPPDDLSLGDYFPLQEFVKVFKITYVQSELWFPHLKKFFRDNYGPMVRDREAYLEHLFKVLWCIYSRERPFFDNLLAAHSFIFCATVYFCYNGWYTAIFHPFRVLASHFETQLRIPFAQANGFKGLAKFCENHDMLKMYEYYCERNITKEHQALEKDVKVRVGKEVYDILTEYDDLLYKKPEKVEREVEVQGTLAWVYHKDLDVRQKRIIGNEWKFKDTQLLSVIMSSLDKKPPALSPQGVPETSKEYDSSTVLKQPLVSLDVMKDMRKLLVEFNANIYELEKRVENLME